MKRYVPGKCCNVYRVGVLGMKCTLIGMNYVLRPHTVDQNGPIEVLS